MTVRHFVPRSFFPSSTLIHDIQIELLERLFDEALTNIVIVTNPANVDKIVQEFKELQNEDDEGKNNSNSSSAMADEADAASAGKKFHDSGVAATEKPNSVPIKPLHLTVATLEEMMGMKADEKKKE